MRLKSCGQVCCASKLVQLREEGTFEMGFDGWVGVSQVEKSRRKCQVEETGGRVMRGTGGGAEGWGSATPS